MYPSNIFNNEWSPLSNIEVNYHGQGLTRQQRYNLEFYQAEPQEVRDLLRLETDSELRVNLYDELVQEGFEFDQNFLEVYLYGDDPYTTALRKKLSTVSGQFEPQEDMIAKVDPLGMYRLKTINMNNFGSWYNKNLQVPMPMYSTWTAENEGEYILLPAQQFRMELLWFKL